MFVELFLHLQVTLRRHQALDEAGFEDAVAVEVAEQEHHAVAGEYADHAHHHHDVRVAVAEAGNHAAGNQGDVFGNGNAETAGNQHHEYGGIAVLGEQGF